MDEGGGVEGARATLELGIVVERRPATSRWQEWVWRPVEVVPGLAPLEGWRLLVEGPGWTRWLAGTRTLELHRKETTDYKFALSAEPPQLYVVLRRSEGDPPFRPFLVTASPFEAQAYAEPGEDLVEAVPMPEPVVAFVQAFVERHHVDQPFLKRRRKEALAAPDAASEFAAVDLGEPGDRGGKR